MRVTIGIVSSCVLLVGCKAKRPTSTSTGGAGSGPAEVEIPAEKVVKDQLEPGAAAALAEVVGPVSPACAAKTARHDYTAYRDARGRRWIVATCDGAGAEDDHALVLVAGFPDQPVAGLVPSCSDDKCALVELATYELPGAPLVCVDTYWHDPDELREGSDTDCIRAVGGKLTTVYTMNETSLADGTTASFTVHAGPPEEIRDLVDCDSCEICMFEEDCTVIPEGVQRYVTRMVWNGATFAAQGDPVRSGAAPAAQR